jgi:hypothetical protein
MEGRRVVVGDGERVGKLWYELNLYGKKIVGEEKEDGSKAEGDRTLYRHLGRVVEEFAFRNLWNFERVFVIRHVCFGGHFIESIICFGILVIRQSGPPCRQSLSGDWFN